MKRQLFLIIALFFALIAISSSAEKQYRNLISKLDVAEEARAISPNSPALFWQTAIDNNEAFAKFVEDIQKNKGAEKEAKQKTAALPRLYPQFDERITESMQGFCDTLLLDMGIADLNLKCSLYIIGADEANAFTALTEDGFAICLTSGLIEKKGVDYNILMGYVAHEFVHGALMHHMRGFYAESKKRKKNEAWAYVALGLCAVASTLDTYDAAGYDTPAIGADYGAVVANVESDAKLSSFEYCIEYSQEQEYEADLIAFRFLENLGLGDSFIDGLRILGTEYDQMYDKYAHHPTISSRINFLKYVKDHPELTNRENKKLRKKRSK